MRRGRLFLALSVAGLAIAAGLAAYYGWRRLHDPTFPVGARAVIVLLILLNSRQNLRQARYAKILETLTGETHGEVAVLAREANG